MKPEPFRFSPTSAGVRIEHLNFNESNNRGLTSDANNSDSNNSRNNKRILFSLPRARPPAPSSPESSYTSPHKSQYLIKDDLEQVIVQNSKLPKRNKNLYEKSEKKSNKMRNCCVVTGVVVLIALLSFILFVECRSVKISPKKYYDEEVSSESRVQVTSIQEPDSESSEESPTKIVSTTGASKGSSSTSSASPFSSKSTTTKSGRLTRSRVSVVCKGGYVDSGENDFSTTTPSKKTSTSRKPRRKSVDLPTLLPRESDGDEEDDRGGEARNWNDDESNTSVSSEETQQHIVTLTGYSHVIGGKPVTKSLKSSSNSGKISNIPKPSPDTTTDGSKTRKPNDELESSEEVGVEITPKPKTKSNSRQERRHKTSSSKDKISSGNEKSETVSNVAQAKSLTQKHSSSTKASPSSNYSSYHRQHQRDSSEETDGGEESAEPTTKRSRHRSSKKSSKRAGSHGKQATSPPQASKEQNEKGDSGELEEDSLFPTLRKSKAERKSSRKSERKQKAKAIPVALLVSDPELESAEAEPAAVEVRRRPEIVTTSSSSSVSSSKSSRSRKASGGEQKQETSTSKPLPFEESSEEYNLEEMPLEHTEKYRRSTGSLSSSHRSSRMRSRTSTAPKMRTRMFSSVEDDD